MLCKTVYIYIYIYIYIIVLLTCTGSHAFMLKCYVHTSCSYLRVLRAHLTPSVLAYTLDSFSNKKITHHNMCIRACVACTSQSFFTRRHSRLSFKQKNHTSYVHISLLLYSQSALKLLPRPYIYIYIYIYIYTHTHIILLTCTGSHAFMFKCYVHISPFLYSQTL